MQGKDRAGWFEPFAAQHLEGVEDVEGMRPVLGVLASTIRDQAGSHSGSFGGV